jgi:RNA polymerase sigma-70 factor (ECF subfamily)
MADTEAIPETLLRRARAGDEAARGQLLELYRNYLHVLARTLISQALQVRLDASDLVQETYLKAHREFAQFLGGGERELIGWLRQILVHTLANQAKHHRARGRDLRRQESLEAALDRSSLAVEAALAAPSAASPSARAVRREEVVLLADALERLPADYRDVFILRNVEQVPVEQVAARMGRSVNAVRKLWTRAMLALRRELEGDEP